tara:strand:+ start:479 stop:754 length:276 start_codon:yes stop_codon:yes gene_type:complete
MTTIRCEIKSELGRKLQNYRADRPDEWTMDEFTKCAEAMQDRILELENALNGVIASPHSKLSEGALLEVRQSDIDVAIKALNSNKSDEVKL